MNELSIRNVVSAFEDEMRKQPQVEMRLEHYFAPGIYARELHIPAGVLLTGKIHKYAQLNILSKGRIRVLTENGVVDVEAPFTVVSPAGTKRIALAITDCVWTTILHTNETDPVVIEKQFIASSEQEYLEFTENNKCLLLQQRS